MAGEPQLTDNVRQAASNTSDPVHAAMARPAYSTNSATAASRCPLNRADRLNAWGMDIAVPFYELIDRADADGRCA